MRSSQLRDRERRRGVLRAFLACISILCLFPMLTGCIPGFGWGGDDSEGDSTASDRNGPALNRTYKSSFLSLQVPSLGESRVRGQLMPDSGPAIFTAFATVETRRPPQPNTPVAFGLRTESAVAFEPAILPAAQSLDKFYSALAALASGRRQRPVMVAHFGDDRIVNDRFAGTLHDFLVGRFGNAGRGPMMPGLFPIRGMKVDRGGQWTLVTAAADQQPGPYGITGVRMASAASDAWLRFTAAQTPFDWLEVTFLTGPRRGSALVSADGDVKLIPTAAPGVNETTIRIAARSSEIVIRPKGDGEIAVLSVATGLNAPGLVYANLGLPGAAAWTPLRWDAGFAANDLAKLNPDLIILSYGTREGFEDRLDLREYETRLRLVIDQIKEWAPQASLLIVGPPDAARLPPFAVSGGAQICRALSPQEVAAYGRMTEAGDERLARWHAPPLLDPVRLALRRTAATSGAFYWDWAKYMGGPCSVHAWTSAVPALAAPDHVTLTEAGNERSARALFAELMAGYDAYQRALQVKAQAIVASSDQKPKPVKSKRNKPQP